MREYGKISPQFWIGSTGKRLRGKPEAQLVALYLMTAPGASMTGVYYCPKVSIAHETGLDMQGASKGLQSLIQEGFCEYDEDSETVFVVKMAEYQIGDRLAPKDNRIIGLRKEVEKMAPTAIRRRFLDVYGEKFHLETGPKIASTSEAPSKPHRSQEQEQEQDTSKRTSPDGDVSTASGKPSTADDCPHQAIIDLYHETLPTLRRVRDWTAARRKLLRARWREKAEHRSLDFWRTFLGYVAASDFLMGRKQSRDGRLWECDLEWLLRPSNFVKVVEGKYENTEPVEAARA